MDNNLQYYYNFRRTHCTSNQLAHQYCSRQVGKQVQYVVIIGSSCNLFSCSLKQFKWRLKTDKSSCQFLFYCIYFEMYKQNTYTRITHTRTSHHLTYNKFANPNCICMFIWLQLQHSSSVVFYFPRLMNNKSCENATVIPLFCECYMAQSSARAQQFSSISV